MTKTGHDISIGVARSDEPDDAYFWRCACGKTGQLRATEGSAVAGGRAHFVAATKRRRPHDPTRYAAAGAPPPTPEQVERLHAEFNAALTDDDRAYIEKLRVARERRRAERAQRSAR